MNKYTKASLIKKGFKETSLKNIFVNKHGELFNYNTKRFLKPNFRGYININSKPYNLAKLILSTFKKIPIRNGKILFLNGNNKDFRLDNLFYNSSPKQIKPNDKDLLFCIRLYFEIEINTKAKSPIIKYYLNEIIKFRGFQNRNIMNDDFKIFLECYLNDFWLLNQSQTNIFKKNNYTQINGRNAVNKYLSLLINECLEDFEKGFLKIKNFKPPTPTKRNKLKEMQKELDINGIEIKIPLRKSSNTEKRNTLKKQFKPL